MKASTGATPKSEDRHVVFLLHGIRTQGEWAQRAAAVLEHDPYIRARPIRYEFFDVVRFLLPVSWIREKPVKRIARLVRDELSRKPSSISFVAHSFGTYVVSTLLEREPDIHINRLLFCGSIVADDFDWGRYGHRLGSDKTGDWQVLNDCGMQDLWPVLAKSITWGYGSSGRFGFGHPRVSDRFFNIPHSGFFSEDFMMKYWLPYLSNGEIVPGVLDRPINPWWVSVLTVAKLRTLVLISAIALATAFGAPFMREVSRAPIETARLSPGEAPAHNRPMDPKAILGDWKLDFRLLTNPGVRGESPHPWMRCNIHLEGNDERARGVPIQCMWLGGPSEAGWEKFDPPQPIQNDPERSYLDLTPDATTPGKFDGLLRFSWDVQDWKSFRIVLDANGRLGEGKAEGAPQQPDNTVQVYGIQMTRVDKGQQ